MSHAAVVPCAIVCLTSVTAVRTLPIPPSHDVVERTGCSKYVQMPSQHLHHYALWCCVPLWNHDCGCPCDAGVCVCGTLWVLQSQAMIVQVFLSQYQLPQYWFYVGTSRHTHTLGAIVAQYLTSVRRCGCVVVHRSCSVHGARRVPAVPCRAVAGLADVPRCLPYPRVNVVGRCGTYDRGTFGSRLPRTTASCALTSCSAWLRCCSTCSPPPPTQAINDPLFGTSHPPRC